MMNELNNPKISTILKKFQLQEIPEMHCYLSYNDQIIDITFPDNNLKTEYINEEKIEPEFLGNYKIEKHRQFIQDWLVKNPHILYSQHEVLQIRELCIEQSRTL